MIRMLRFLGRVSNVVYIVVQNGMILNADCHAAANIMRKAVPDIWEDTRDFSFLSSPEVYGFHKLNPEKYSRQRDSGISEYALIGTANSQNLLVRDE